MTIPRTVLRPHKYPNLLSGYFGSERGTGPNYAAALAPGQRDWAIPGPKLVLPRLYLQTKSREHY